jgi:hypothetical protein
LHNIAPILLGMVYQLVFFGLAVWVAARIFGSDHILTLQFKLAKLRRR